jgi:dsDNA-specific endonuclease/ATPase MutS2
MPKEEGKKKIEEDASLLRHLINSLDESEGKLEEFYEKKDPDNFNKIKKFILQITQKISEVTK